MTIWSPQWLLQFKQITRKIFSGLQQDSNPWPLSYRCSALPFELWRPIHWGRPICWVLILIRQRNEPWRWCELRKYYKIMFRYDRRCGYCNLSNCKKKKKYFRGLFDITSITLICNVWLQHHSFFFMLGQWTFQQILGLGSWRWWTVFENERS